jgi:hypothetical protein
MPKVKEGLSRGKPVFQAGIEFLGKGFETPHSPILIFSS